MGGGDRKGQRCGEGQAAERGVAPWASPLMCWGGSRGARGHGSPARFLKGLGFPWRGPVNTTGMGREGPPQGQSRRGSPPNSRAGQRRNAEWPLRRASWRVAAQTAACGAASPRRANPDFRFAPACGHGHNATHSRGVNRPSHAGRLSETWSLSWSRSLSFWILPVAVRNSATRPRRQGSATWRCGPRKGEQLLRG